MICFVSNLFYLFTEARFPRSLEFRVENGIEYVTYPYNNGKCSGYVKVGPGQRKIPKKSITRMVRKLKKMTTIFRERKKPTKLQTKDLTFIFFFFHLIILEFHRFNGENPFNKWKREYGIQIRYGPHNFKR